MLCECSGCESLLALATVTMGEWKMWNSHISIFQKHDHQFRNAAKWRLVQGLTPPLPQDSKDRLNEWMDTHLEYFT